MAKMEKMPALKWLDKMESTAERKGWEMARRKLEEIDLKITLENA